MTLDLTTIANEAYDYVLAAWEDLLRESESESDLECHEVYLCVAADGDWAIDHAQYFSGFYPVAIAAIAPYESADALADELERSLDLDAAAE